jgi:Domain of unknown function (DUF4188)
MLTSMRGAYSAPRLFVTKDRRLDHFAVDRASTRMMPGGTRVRVERRTVDLSDFPDLVVIYLGMRVNVVTGLKTLLGFGRRIDAAVRARPDGLLLHEPLVFSLVPPHVGMRQYWRDFDTLEQWVRSEPHRQWWREFLADSGGTGFWHETYMRRGGVEAIYDDMTKPIGMMKFAPLVPARGPMFSARSRAARGTDVPASPVSEADLYGPEPTS